METPRYQTHDTKLGLFALFASILRYKGSNAVGEGCECFFRHEKTDPFQVWFDAESNKVSIPAKPNVGQTPNKT